MGVLQCGVMNTGSHTVSAMKIRHLLPLTIVIVACGSEAHAQTNAVPASRTLASLMAEGYEAQTVQLFKDKIWMRKPGGEGVIFICDRGRIGSAAFEAYRKKEYDQISCSIAQ
jgi:hypothetical protein